MWRHYVYLHREADTGTVFYVGKGSRSDRARSTAARSAWWKRKVAKHGFDVEILAHFCTDADAQAFEIEQIALYGRADTQRGDLVNLTDGGDGHAGIVASGELRAKRSAAASAPRSAAWVQSIQAARKGGGNGGVVKKGDKLSQVWRDNIARTKAGEANPMFGRASSRRRAVTDTHTGEVFPSLTAAASARGIRVQVLHNQLTGHRPNRTGLVFAL